MRSPLLLLGVLLAIWLPASLHAVALWMMVAAAALALNVPQWRPALVLALGFFLASHAASRILEQRVSCDERVLARAQVVTVPERQGAGWQFDALLQFPRQPERSAVTARVTSSQSGGSRPHAGEVWQLALQLRGAGSVPVGDGTGSADRRVVLLRDGVGVEARMLKSPLNKRLAPASRSLPALRERIASRIDAQVADPSAAALLAALAVGVTGDVSRQQWRVFSATGITHLVAISGMHVTFFAMLSMAMARRLWMIVPGFAGQLRRETFASAIGILLATAYALLSGFSVPAQRTLVMLAAFIGAREFARASGALWSVAVALAAVLLYDPLSVLSAGFWLSFAAVAAIIQVAGAQVGEVGAMRSAVLVQVVVSVALLPITLLIFGTFSSAGLLVNALAIPVFTFLLVPPVLLATLGYMVPTEATWWLGDRLLDLAAWVAGVGWPWLSRAADLHFGLLYATPVSAWYLVAIPAVALVVMPWRPALRALGAGLLLSVLLMRPAAPQPGGLWLEVLDVGAATSVILSTAHHRLVFGTGEAFGTRGRRFEERVARRLGNNGRGVPAVLVTGKLNADRLRAVLAGDALLNVGLVVRDAGGNGPPEIRDCSQRDWIWDEVRLALSPGPSGNSCFLTAVAGKRRIVLSQDALGPGPADLLFLPRNLDSGQLPSIAQTLRPGGRAIVSIDQRAWQSSRWHELRRAFADQGLALYSTTEEGAMHFEFGTGSGIRMHSSRGTRPGIWRQPLREHSCAVGL